MRLQDLLISILTRFNSLQIKKKQKNQFFGYGDKTDPNQIVALQN